MATQKGTGADYDFKNYSQEHLRLATNKNENASILTAAGLNPKLGLDDKSGSLQKYIASIESLPKGTNRKDIVSMVEEWKKKRQEYANQKVTDDPKGIVTVDDYNTVMHYFDEIIFLLEAHVLSMKKVHRKTVRRLNTQRSKASIKQEGLSPVDPNENSEENFDSEFGDVPLLSTQEK